MTDPDIATVLRQMKIPERMTSSQALRDFLLANTEDGRNVPTGPEQVLQLNGLLLLSHLEVINALGGRAIRAGALPEVPARAEEAPKAQMVVVRQTHSRRRHTR